MVEVGEGFVVDIGVEVGAVGKALGIGRDPAAEYGVVIAAAEADVAGELLGRFTPAPPCAGDAIGAGFLFPKGAIMPGAGKLAREGDQGADVAVD